MAVEVRLMGAVEVDRDGDAIAVGGPRQQMLIAVLALSAGAPVSTERLIELVWDERPPRTARRTVQSYVAALRRAIGPGAPLRGSSGGYVLDVPRHAVDLLAFEDEVAVTLARTEAVPDAVAAVLGSALQRWRTPLELAQPTARIRGLLAPYEELRLQAIDALVAAQIDSGHADRAVRRLERMVREHPTRENLWLQLARGLERLGRRDDALQAIQRAREQLRVELGIDPSHELVGFEQQLLTDQAVGTDPATGDAALPSGRVTFVFTDIEGSTRLLRTLGADYDTLLDEHRRILRHAWSTSGGHEVSTDGDSFFVAFHDVGSAVRACIAGQEGLHANAWPGGVTVRVRMGIHSGLGYPRNGDYAALAVNQAARIAESAHGGQVLITASAAAALEPQLGDRLRPLGRFRVRDFDAPVSLSGVDTGNSPAHELAPRLVPADGHNLTRPAGSFVARTDDVTRVAKLLESDRLVTITGPGGVGKTRLAIEAGLEVAAAFGDGVWMLALDSIEDDAVIDGALADAFGLAGRAEPWRELVDHLGRRRALVVLDNCEHLRAGVVDLIARLLAACPDVAVLATSREPLDLLDERVVRLAPLDITSSGSGPPDAVRLFLDRAAPTQDTESDGARRAIERICADLDGLPLAIELAAARTDTLPPGAIADALARRSPTLSTTDPRVPSRQRSMARLLDWSYGLLDTVEQAALRRLTLFPASFDLTTARAAIGGDDVDPAVAPELVWSLAAKSLVLAEPAAGATRYRLLRTVRSYARTYLADGELIDASRRLTEHFTSRLGPDRALDRSWIGDVALELNNLRSLIVTTRVDESLRQQLAWSIGRFHDLTDQYAVGIDELDRHLDLLRRRTPARVALLTLAADLRLRVGDLAGARSAIDDAASLSADVGPPEWDDAGVVRTQGDLAMRGERFDEARRIAEEALDDGLSTRGRARLLDLLGLTLSAMGDLDGSAQALEHEARLWTEVGDDSFVASTLSNLAETEWRRGRLEAAARHQLACLEIARALDQPVLVAFAMVMAAQVSAKEQRWDDAVELQLAADAVLADVGFVLFDSDAAARRELLDEAARHVEFHTIGADSMGDDGVGLEVAIAAAARTLESVE